MNLRNIPTIRNFAVAACDTFPPVDPEKGRYFVSDGPDPWSGPLRLLVAGHFPEVVVQHVPDLLSALESNPAREPVGGPLRYTTAAEDWL